MVNVTKEHAEKHYADLSARPFFPALVEYSAFPRSAAGRPCASDSARHVTHAALLLAVLFPPRSLLAPASRRPPVCSGPVVAMVWCGIDVVKQGRAMIGATNPLASTPGTIRGDFCIQMGRNIIHGSDAVESAQHEIALWFPEGVCEYQRAITPWIYE